MSEIKIEHNPSDETLEELDIWNWPIWTKEVSEFPWSYDEGETCYFLDGDVIVTPDGGEPVRGQGALHPVGGPYRPHGQMQEARGERRVAP